MEKESPLPEPQKEDSPLPEPQKEEVEVEEEEESPLPQPKKRSGPRCKYPRPRRLPPGMAPAHYGEKPVYHDPENIPIMEVPGLLEDSVEYAEAALSYLSQQGQHFKLFRPDFIQGGIVGGGARFHHNFLAKPAHDPDAPPETFFNQVFLRKDPERGFADVTVECCVSLGPSHSLPKRRDSRRCMYCTIYIHHPKDDCEGMIC